MTSTTFEEDYLYFYETILTPDRTERDVKLLRDLLDPQPGIVLDLACGYGRITNQLAAGGWKMIGLDCSDFFLDLARLGAEQQGIEVEYIQGDMRSLSWTEHFNCIVNNFNAFGYFDDDDNRRVLVEAHRALKPGGKLLIDHLNRDRMIKEFQSTVVTERDRNYMIAQSRYDVPSGRVYTERIVIRDGQTRRWNYFIRVFTYPELRDWLLQAGFSQVEGYAPDGKPLSLDAASMIVVATKE